MIRPVLARTSSAASGLRFCGMIEEPVVKRSESVTKPNCGVAQITISSAKRERCTAQIDAAASDSSAKSRSDDGVERVRRRPVEAERLRGRARGRSGKAVPASAAAPSGHSFSRLRHRRSGRGRAHSIST